MSADPQTGTDISWRIGMTGGVTRLALLVRLRPRGTSPRRDDRAARHLRPCAQQAREVLLEVASTGACHPLLSTEILAEFDRTLRVLLAKRGASADSGETGDSEYLRLASGYQRL